MTDLTKQTLYLYDLPKDSSTSVKIHNTVKTLTGYDLQDIPQIRRDLNKPFYTAMLRISDPASFIDIKKKMKYFKLDGNDCRSLPYLKEITAAYRTQNNSANNLFIKGLPKDLTTESLDSFIQNKLLGDYIVSAKVSINSDRTSRGYGFVCFENSEKAAELFNLAQNDETFSFQVSKYQPKDRREIRKSFNNIYVKNFPENWGENELRAIFAKYGEIKSLAVLSAPKPGTDTQSKFAFVCYENPNNKNDKEYGPRCALNAVE